MERDIIRDMIHAVFLAALLLRKLRSDTVELMATSSSSDSFRNGVLRLLYVSFWAIRNAVSFK